MANSLFTINITTQDSAQAVKDQMLLMGGQSPVRSLANLETYIGKLCGGVKSAKLVFLMNAVQATGTITFSALANNDTVTVNGRVYTAKTSGATGLQQFNLGANDTAAALNFQAIVNADTSALVAGIVVASSSSAGVTKITAVTPGVVGNGITIAISAHGSVTGSGLLTGGTSDAPITVSHGI